MKLTHTLTALALLATGAVSALAPARADRQSDKNNMRNLAIAGAAVAGYGLFSHNNTVALLGAAGAGLAGSQYEQDRHQQSQNSDRRYYYRNGNRYNNDTRHNDGNGRGNDNRNYSDTRNGGSYGDARGWTDSRNYDRNYSDNGGRGDSYGNDSRQYNDSQNRRDNGNRDGWDKHSDKRDRNRD